jgi:hypothetical protein
MIRALVDLHRKNMDNHIAVMEKIITLLGSGPPEPRPQHIIITGPTTASALAPLPGTELTIFRMIPSARRLWGQCLGTNYRFEPTSFVRLFPNCGHYFWYRHQFRMENGIAMCPQCDAEEQIVIDESAAVSRARVQPFGPPQASSPTHIPIPSSPPPPPPRSILEEGSILRRRNRVLPNISSTHSSL